MISPELLRRYPFFSFLTPKQQHDVAMITEELNLPAGTTIFRSGDPADTFYLLLDGSVDLSYDVRDELKTGKEMSFHVGIVNPGEPLAISALIEPYELTTTAVAADSVRLLRLDAPALRDLAAADMHLAYHLQRQIACTTMDRLRSTRVELLAASAPEPQRSAAPLA